MAAVVAGVHNTDSPHSGGEMEATMAANAMQGKQEQAEEEEVWEGEVAFEAALESGLPSHDWRKNGQESRSLHFIQRQPHPSDKVKEEEECVWVVVRQIAIWDTAR